MIGNKDMDVISDKTDALRILPEAAAELCTALFRNSPAGIYITRDGKFIYTNIEFRHITGYSQDELSGKDYLRLINPRYRHKPKQNVASLFEEEEEDTSHEFKITTREGKKRWISEKITYFKYGGNWLTLGHWLDISEPHSIETAWREAERRFQSAFEDLSTGLAIIGTDGIFLKVNKAFYDMVSYEEKDLLESRFDDTVCPEDREQCGDIMALFLSLEKPEIPSQRRLQAKDGRIVWTAMSISLIGDSESGPSYFIVHFQDITEQKRIEDGLKEEEWLYRSLVDLSLEPLAVTDLDCYITHASQKFIDLLGYAGASDILGKKIGSMVTPGESENFQAGILQILRGGKPAMMNGTLLKKDGATMAAVMNITWINNDKGTPVCIVIQSGEIKEPGAAATVAPETPKTNDETTAERAADIQAAPSDLALALENTSTALILMNADTIIAAVNQAFEKMSGYPREEIEGKKSWIEFVAQEDQARLKRYYLLRRLDPASAPNTYEFKLSDRRGNVKDVLINITDVPGTRQQAATLLEVAEYKQAMQEAHTPTTPPQSPAKLGPAHDNKYFAYLDAMPGSAVVINAGGIITYASRKAVNMMAKGIESDIMGKSYLKFIRPGLIQNANESFRQLFDIGYFEKVEIELMRTDGRLYPVEMSARLIASAEWESAEAVCLFKDATIQKTAEQAREESEKYYHLLAEHITDVVWIMDNDLNFIWLSDSSEKLSGFTNKETMCMTLDQLVTPDCYKTATDFCKQAMQDENEGKWPPDHIFSLDLEIVHKNGSTLWAENKFQFIRDQQGKATGFVAWARDITERKKAEETLEFSLARLEKTVEGAIAAMATVIEMRDPYTAGHQERVARIAGAIAREMELPDDLVKGVEITGKIHDIGKIYVPMEILSKPGKLSAIERQIIQSHSRGSYDILKSIDFPWPVAQTALQHHERLDGSGYPQGLKENEIMLEAKILMVADVVEAMASHRPYRASRGLEAALEEISGNSSMLYDPGVVDACLRLFREHNFSFEETGIES
ncbi:MAG: PAS domain S-box protein [Dehalococcoidia bacterium]|nr:PAS domain S-box protein [Dehalococcoidia bacterium]